MLCILSLVYILSYTILHHLSSLGLEAWRLWLVAYLLGAYLTREKISGSWQGMQQEACHGRL
jgi:hypothetical protein